MKLYKSTDEYRLLDTSVFSLPNNIRGWYIDCAKNQFDWEQLISNEFNTRKSSRINNITLGNGLIFIGWKKRLFGVLCTPKNVIFNGENKNDLVLLINGSITDYYNADFKRIKTLLNSNGLSSRRQIKLISETELNKFVFDPLNPTMDKLNDEAMSIASKDFINEFKLNNNEEINE